MRFDPVALLLHAIFGAFLGALVWFGGATGMSGGGWFATKTGACAVILVGAVVGAIAGVFRDKQIVRIDQDAAAGMGIGFKVFLKIGLPLALGLYVIWSLLH